MPASRYRLFERYGVELEYMIVDAETLQVKPIADRLVGPGRGRGGQTKSATARRAGPTSWCCM
jgi:glutamate---cysteine ligase / carboxylate-amine ligase